MSMSLSNDSIPSPLIAVVSMNSTHVPLQSNLSEQLGLRPVFSDVAASTQEVQVSDKATITKFLVSCPLHDQFS